MICQSEFSIQRRSNGNINNNPASAFGSKYRMTANIYTGGIPFTCWNHAVKSFNGAGSAENDLK